MTSIKGQLNKEEVKAYIANTIRFTAPTLAVFFLQLSLGADLKIAISTALLAFYQNLSDLFKKIGQGK